jgi:predicted GNAT family acetyltransferase
VISSVPLAQMVHRGDSVPGADGDEVVQLTEADVPEMLALTKLTSPGPFGTRTREMGDYWGVRRDGKLIAMAGERLKIPGYTEISAVCTHPDYLGCGLATRLIGLVLSKIHGRGERAFLHVRPENERALWLYERFGFETRVLLQYAILAKNS